MISINPNGSVNLNMYLKTDTTMFLFIKILLKIIENPLEYNIIYAQKNKCMSDIYSAL